MIYLGGAAGNNVTSANIGDPNIATEGDKIEITVDWTGSPLIYNITDLITETDLSGSGLKGIEIRFGGNYLGVPGTNPSDNTGCITCLYSCSAGITSNAMWNANLNGLDGDWRGKGNFTNLPTDGTTVTITMQLVGP